MVIVHMTEITGTASERLERIVGMFAAVPKGVRLEALLDYSRRLPELPGRLASRPELLEVVPECQSPFALIAERDGDVVRLHFRVPPEAPTVRGFAGILHEALDGASADEILAVPDDFYQRMGLREAVSSQRLNGMAAILGRIKLQTASLGRPWIATPEVDNEAVEAATQRSWDEWCDVIDAWDGRDEGHAAIAAYLYDEHPVDRWWAQTITVGYERITGLRLPYQMPDGTFTATKTRTLAVAPQELREMLLDSERRTDLFPGLETELRSGPTSKAIRLKIGPGIALVSLEPRGQDGTTITVAHEQLPAFELVEEWKHYWAAWFDTLQDARQHNSSRDERIEPLGPT